MDSDYGQALNGFHSQMSAYAGNLGMFQEQKDIYSQQLQTAKDSAMKKISDDKITDAVSAVAGLGAYAAKKVSLEDFKKRVDAGAFKGDTYRGYADKLRAKAKTFGEKEADPEGASGAEAGAEEAVSEGTEGAEAAASAAADTATAASAAAETSGTYSSVAVDSVDTTMIFGQDEEGELIGNTIGGEAGQAAAETTTAATTAVSNTAAGISDTVGAAGEAASGAVEAGLTIGTQVATDSALAVAGGLDAVGTFLDATGIGAGVGVILQVAAVGEGIAGAYDAGKEIYDNVKKVGTDAVQSAQQAVQKVGVMKENWKSVLPTYDTSELIHSSGAW